MAGFANGVCEYDSITEYAAECQVMESQDFSTMGGNCDIDVDECVSSPCVNGAVCAESNSTTNTTVDSDVSLHAYRCTCVAGFANGVCEYDFITEYAAECQVMESQNLSTMGGNCDIDVDECRSSPCMNNATCDDSNTSAVVSMDNFSCTCMHGYANDVCAVDVDECASAPCQSNATCIESGTNMSESGLYVVLEGTEGTNTTNSTNDNMVPADLNISIGSFECVCKAGWTGGLCETDVDECDSNPCENGGTCVESNTTVIYFRSLTRNLYRLANVSIDIFRCDCAAGHQGLNCSVDINECDSAPCQNGATCLESTSPNSTVLPNNYTCNCSAGWASAECVEDIDECLSAPCMNGATCNESSTDAAGIGPDQFACGCVAAFFGGTCEFDSDECASVPCQNGAGCIESNTTGTALDIAPGRFACNCTVGWNGTECEVDADECLSLPCLNGASCDGSGHDMFLCSCAFGWDGPLCNRSINPCFEGESVQCDARANCSHTGPGLHVCSCEFGFDGDGTLSDPCRDIDECHSARV